MYSDSLRAGRSGHRIPVGGGGRDFLYLSRQAVGPTQPPIFPGVRRPLPGFVLPPSRVEVKERAELHLYSPLGLGGLF